MAVASAYIVPESFAEDLLQCSICFDSFKQPKILPCSHVFCANCVMRHFDYDKLRNRGKVSCPTCRVCIPLPEAGISGFRDDISKEKYIEIINRINFRNGLFSDGGDKADIMESLAEKTVGEKVEHLQSWQLVLQNEMAKLREDMLETSVLEDHIKNKRELECEAVIKGKKAKILDKKVRVKIADGIQASHDFSMAQIAIKQDKIHKNYATLKCMFDLVEELISKVSLDDLSTIIDRILFMMECLKRRIARFNDESEVGGTVPDRMYGEYSDGKDGIIEVSEEDLGIDYTSGRHLYAKQRPAFPKPDYDHIGARLLFKVSGRGAKPGFFDWPTHATFTPTGEILVADKNNLRLQRFDSSGRLVSVLLGGHIKPRRVRMNPLDGLLYLSDELSECCKVFTLDGKLVRRFAEQMPCPAGLDFDSKGNVVVSDAENSTVILFSPRGGDPLYRMTVRSINDKQVPNPYFVATNDEDNILISDHRNNCVKVNSSDGKFLFKILKLNCPRGICSDPYGNILIAESDKHCVSMYNPYGKFMHQILSAKDGLKFPMSLDMNHEGKLVVTQCGPTTVHELLVFQLYT